MSKSSLDPTLIQAYRRTRYSADLDGEAIVLMVDAPSPVMAAAIAAAGAPGAAFITADRAQLTQEFDEMMADTLESDAPNPADTADASEQAWALHQCLAQLEGRQREVVSLAYLRDMSHGELSEQLKLPLGTVKTWIRRGLEKMRTCMGRFA